MIDRFAGEHAFLSNFYPSEVSLDGVGYPTVEHAYQAAKSFDPEYRGICRAAGTPGMAKKLGRRVALRPLWDDVRIEVMTALVRQKFLAPALREKLLATGDEELVEGNYWGDRFWGVSSGRGENHLGLILMSVRDTVRLVG